MYIIDQIIQYNPKKYSKDPRLDENINIFLVILGWGWLVVCQDVHSINVFVWDDLIFPEDIENNINTEKAKKDL